MILQETKHFINVTRSRKKFCLSLHYSESNSFLYANSVKLYQFQTKDSDIKPYSLFLGNILTDFTIDDMKNKFLFGFYAFVDH